MLHRTGWSCPTWPVEYGGKGLSPLEAVILTEELAEAGAPIQPPAGGEILVGPTILHWGDDRQKKRFLPPIVRGTEIWCQGFSEPDAGSDLASLQTTAVRDGEDWVINGTKIWTSEAPDADMVFLLARTDPRAPRHRGISYLLVEMHQPGVVVEPIAQPDGTAGFARVHFEGARCAIDNVLGGEGNGWMVANSTLGFERGISATTSYRRFEGEALSIIDVARHNGRLTDPIIRQRLARLWTDIQIMRINGYRMVTGLVRPELQEGWPDCSPSRRCTGPSSISDSPTSASTSSGPVARSSAERPARRTVVGVGMGHRTALHDYPASPAQSTFLFARSGTIFGGTSEIQRNVIAERVSVCLENRDHPMVDPSPFYGCVRGAVRWWRPSSFNSPRAFSRRNLGQTSSRNGDIL